MEASTEIDIRPFGLLLDTKKRWMTRLNYGIGLFLVRGSRTVPQMNDKQQLRNGCHLVKKKKIHVFKIGLQLHVLGLRKNKCDRGERR